MWRLETAMVHAGHHLGPHEIPHTPQPQAQGGQAMTRVNNALICPNDDVIYAGSECPVCM